MESMIARLFLIFTMCAISIASGIRCSAESLLASGQLVPDTQPQVSCSAESPVVPEQGTDKLRAWVLAPSGESPEFSWTVSVGKILSAGSEVTWSFENVRAAPRSFQATVTVKIAKYPDKSCSVEVYVTEAERSEVRETGRSFLIKGGSKEPEGFGLYSYLLFGTRPEASNRQRFVRAVEACLQRMEDVTKLQGYRSPSTLNVTFLPLETAPPSPSSPVSADWILDHYDYARARVLLGSLPGDLREGPYLVSVFKPLASAVPREYLFQNLSLIPDDDDKLISWWVREFLSQAAQERFWEPRTFDSFVLKLRTTIAVLSSGLQPVQKGLESWVSWIH
jgi:hypothetical protein